MKAVLQLFTHDGEDDHRNGYQGRPPRCLDFTNSVLDQRVMVSFVLQLLLDGKISLFLKSFSSTI